MTDRKAIEARIAELKGELAKVEGRPTEVYSRIVGYYRSVRNWNAGKRDEYSQRRTYGMPSGLPSATAPAPAALVKAPPEAAPAKAAPPLAAASHAASPAPARAPSGAPAELFASAHPERSGMLVFTRKACPNCPPVANYVESAGLPAVFVDVDAEEGLALARRHGVMATPTVVGLDSEGREAFRACGLGELKARLEPQAARV